MIHIHGLDGCAPAPLAYYLKAIGILRLVAEQADRDARGWWEGEHFRLATKLTREDLEAFFSSDYQPTPMFNPWGARSGFYAGGSEKSARKSLKEIECSENPRLEPFRNAIETVRKVIPHSTDAKPSNKEKEGLILALRSNVRGVSSCWLDTVVALIGAGDDVSVAQPPIFGTGGNEGSGGYPSAYMSAVVEAVVKSNWDHAIPTALFGGVSPRCRWDQSLGQFAPGGISTPWDMLLGTLIEIKFPTSSWTQFVVPVAVELVSMKRQGVHLRVGGDLAGRILSLVELGFDPKPRGGSRFADQVDNGFEGT